MIDAGGFIESYRNEAEAREHKRMIDEFFAGGLIPKYHFRESEHFIVEKFDHADIITDRKHIGETAFDPEIRQKRRYGDTAERSFKPLDVEFLRRI